MWHIMKKNRKYEMYDWPKKKKKSRALNTWGWKFKEYTVGLIFLMTYSQSDQCRSNWW